MGKQLIIGSLVGAVIVFIWMMISWMLLPWHCAAMNSFENESEVSEVILNNTQRDGIFVLPNVCSSDITAEERSDAMKKGPVVFASVQRFGFDVASFGPYVISFIIQFLGALIISYFVLQTHLDYIGRVIFIGLAGLLVGILGMLPAWNWWGFSFEYVIIEICDLVIAWLLAGFAMAFLLTPGESKL